MKYFNNVNTLEELRKQYKELLKKYHPDNPDGSTEATQAINTEYDELFKHLKGVHATHTTNKEGKDDKKSNSAYKNMKYDFAEDDQLRKVLQRIIMFEGINIEIIGYWIWVDGNTFIYKDDLKGLGFKWASDKKKWYYHTEAYRKRSKRKMNIDDIRHLYGSTEVETKRARLLDV